MSFHLIIAIYFYPKNIVCELGLKELFAQQTNVFIPDKPSFFFLAEILIEKCYQLCF